MDMGDSAKAVAQAGGAEAVALLIDLMEYNRLEAEWVANSVQRAWQRERDEWRQRALEAEARIARIEDRLWDLSQ